MYKYDIIYMICISTYTVSYIYTFVEESYHLLRGFYVLGINTQCCSIICNL